MNEKTEVTKMFQVINYTAQLPFLIHNITRKGIMDDSGHQRDILEHWHREIEIEYTFAGYARHYIDGKVYDEAPGKMLITNSESIHKIITDVNIEQDVEVVAVVLIINYEFIQSLVPNLLDMYFLTEVRSDMQQIGRIMEEFSKYADNIRPLQPYEELKLMGSMYQLLYLLCRDALASREVVFPINNEKNMERLRGIILYVNEHYTEPIQQCAVAERFYFTREYFSRFFRKNTGMTFKEFLMKVRVRAAREEILKTDKSMLEIAMDTGFTDARSLIHAFKVVYDTTPYQFRKQNKEK